ncbi:MAG: hypothetical protein K8T20_19475 [Planctomycetes bacterium]|nr:hypothetical protein [Planctomycetota bacterium]
MRRFLPFLALLVCGCASGPRRGLVSREDVPPGWSLHTTAHYQVLTDAGDEQARLMAVRLEGILELYGALLPTKRTLPIFPVRVIQKYADYISYGGEDGTGGCYDAETGDLVLTRFEGYGATKDEPGRPTSEQEVVTTAYHEAWHQYFHWYLDSDVDPPAWFDEGMADYFGQARPTLSHRNSALPEPPGERRPAWRFDRKNLAWLSSIRKAVAAGKYVPLRELVHMKRADYYRDPSLCYPEGWALVYFLMNCKDERLSEVPAALVLALRDGSKSDAAVDEAFAGVDFAKLEADWAQYVGQLR